MYHPEKKQVDIDFYYSCSLGKIEGSDDITYLKHRAGNGNQNEALIKVLQTVFTSFRDIGEINWRKVIVIFMSVLKMFYPGSLNNFIQIISCNFDRAE